MAKVFWYEIVFHIERGLCALIGLYVTSKTIDFIQIGFKRTKMVMIKQISRKKSGKEY
jgi:uncharacterized membrane-anchored protein YitT (DUF2179 family)